MLPLHSIMTRPLPPATPAPSTPEALRPNPAPAEDQDETHDL